jgi:class 3 adenylate cyclase
MPPRRERVLVTVLFTDIVGSTEIAAELGDRRWRDLVQRHHALVRRELKRSGGRELDTAGDGFFVRFDRPADAIRCACVISDAVRDLGIEIRAGLHLGEAEVVDGKVGGIGVNVGARVMGVGEGGEVLVSSTLRDAVAGSGFEFADHGTHRLKGIEGDWRLNEVTAVDGVRRSVPLAPEEARERRSFMEPAATGRRRDFVVAAGAGAVVLALVVAAFATGTLGGDRGDPASAAGPSRNQRELLARVPASFRDTCTASEPMPAGGAASVECAPNEAYSVSYTSFRSPEELGAAFENFASVADPTNLDCATAPSARGEYTVNGTRAGEVACYVDEGTSTSTTDSVITWTDEDSLVLGHATRGDAADLTLYEWWRTEAGPWASDADPEKDGTAELLTGTFRNDDGWILEFEGGRYVLEDFGPYSGEDVLLHRKPDEILVFHRIPAHGFGGPCPSYEVYRWRLDGDRLSLRVLDGDCREYYSREISETTWARVD